MNINTHIIIILIATSWTKGHCLTASIGSAALCLQCTITNIIFHRIFRNPCFFTISRGWIDGCSIVSNAPNDPGAYNAYIIDLLTTSRVSYHHAGSKKTKAYIKAKEGFKLRSGETPILDDCGYISKKTLKKKASAWSNLSDNEGRHQPTMIECAVICFFGINIPRQMLCRYQGQWESHWPIKYNPGSITTTWIAD